MQTTAGCGQVKSRPEQNEPLEAVVRDPGRRKVVKVKNKDGKL